MSDGGDFYPSQTQNVKERRKRGRKAKKQGQAKRQIAIQSKSYDTITDEENQGGDQETDKAERDSKYIFWTITKCTNSVIFLFCFHEILMTCSTIHL